MSPTVLLCVLTGWQPFCHPPNFVYPQLPPGHICEWNYAQCQKNRIIIGQRLKLLERGWQYQRLLWLRDEADRLDKIWYAAWSITWIRALPDDRDKWTVILIAHIGESAFWRGEIPDPLELE